jgi:hypothetical protein
VTEGEFAQDHGQCTKLPSVQRSAELAFLISRRSVCARQGDLVVLA